jgi:hypothetical protein
VPCLPKCKTTPLCSHRVRKKANELYCRRRNVEKVKERNHLKEATERGCRKACDEPEG